MAKSRRIKYASPGRIFDYGRVGEFTGKYAYENGYDRKNHKIRVGDVVSYVTGGKAFSGVVMKKSSGVFGIMGRGVDHLDFEKLTILVPCYKVPIEIINAIHGGGFAYVEEEEAEEMTVEEIENALGKRIKIVKEGD